MSILVTGGAGYIGSHTCVELLNAGYDVVVVDNLVNSSNKSLDRVEEITGQKVKFYEVDLRDKVKLEEIFENEKIDSVIHFAGLKAVGESVYKPLEYYDNNIGGSLVLCEVMKKHGVKKLVFSSSATVYGDPATVPIKEDFPLSTASPYGRTKLMLEEIFRDLAVAESDFKIILLRYFNPIGANKSGRIGENPKGIPNNLLPYITQVAVGKLEKLSIFGGDYDTLDGTCVRDYIHVVDLALGHLKAIEYFDKMDENVEAYNLGTGVGYSVIEVVKAFEEVTGITVAHTITDKRAGDVAQCYSDATLAKTKLGWEAERGLKEMCEDSWNWQKNNPNGYE
jgi:UDP-glucose-4-epimerase